MSADLDDLKVTLAALEAKLAALNEEAKHYDISKPISTFTIATLRGQLVALKAATGSVALPREVTIPRPASPRTEPPRAAELLVSWCIRKRYREALLDDLDEVFQRDLTKGMTVARAHLRYWGAALHSITPQILAAAKRIGLFGIIADYARRILH